MIVIHLITWFIFIKLIKLIKCNSVNVNTATLYTMNLTKAISKLYDTEGMDILMEWIIALLILLIIGLVALLIVFANKMKSLYEVEKNYSIMAKNYSTITILQEIMVILGAFNHYRKQWKWEYSKGF